MSDAIGYTRLSQSSDTSITRQKEHIREYANENGFNIVALFDDGERSSGFDSDRTEFQNLRTRVAENTTDAIIVNDKRRLARDFDETMRMILDCRENDIAIHTHQEQRLDISDPMNAAIEVLQAASDYEAKKKEIEKAKEAVEERAENGCYHGKPPMGLQFAPDSCHLERDSNEWGTLRDIIERRENGETVATVANNLDVSTATVSRVANRGMDWYKQRLNEYGQS